MEGYDVGLNYTWPTPQFNTTFTHPYPTTSTQGGYVLQPSGDFIIGAPLKFFRVYGEAGLTLPTLFYNYESHGYNGASYGTGSSMSLGGELAVGARFNITTHMYAFAEDRYSGIFLPFGIKASPQSGSGVDVLDSTLTIKSLNVNHAVVGVGFRWGNPS